MRKVFSLLVLFSLLLVISVKADAGGPTFPTIKAEIINSSGAKCVDGEDSNKVIATISLGKVIEVTERERDDKYYAYEGEEGYCYLKKEDTTVINNKYELKDEDKIAGLKVKVVSNNGVKLHEGGPANAYKEIAAIPKGTVLKGTHIIGTHWFYVEYNGQKGYVSGENDEVVYRIEEGERKTDNIITKTEVDLLNDTSVYWDNVTPKVLLKIPANTEFTDYWLTGYTRYYYLSYKGQEGFVGEVYITHEIEYRGTSKVKNIKLLKEESVFKNLDFYFVDNVSPTKVGKAKANVEYKVKYNDGNIFYVEELGGWLVQFNKHDDDTYGEPIDNIIVTYENGEVYDPRVKDDEEEEQTEPVTPEKEKDTKTETRKISNSELIIICVCAGIFVALTALITIILVNKRKKDEKVEEKSGENEKNN